MRHIARDSEFMNFSVKSNYSSDIHRKISEKYLGGLRGEIYRSIGLDLSTIEIQFLFLKYNQ